MTKKFNALICIMLSLVLFVAACADTTKPEENLTVSLSDSQLRLDRFEDYILTATVTDADGEKSDKQVTWETTDASVIKVSGGTLSPQGIGTATVKATAGTATAVCEVVVEDTYSRPQLMVALANVSVLVGGKYNLAPDVKYKNKSVEGAVYEYLVEDSTVASVTGNTVNGLKFGSTRLTMTAKWKGISGSGAAALTKTLDINVVEDVVITLSQQSAVLYSQSKVESVPFFEDKTFTNTVELSGAVKDKGLDKPGVWVSDNPDVASVNAESGVVTGLSAGIANITLQYTTDASTYSSEPVEVSVVRPEAQTDKEALVPVSTLALSAGDFFPAGSVITAVYDAVDTGRKDNLFSDGKLSLPADELVNGSASAVAERTTRLGTGKYIVETDNYAYICNITIATEIFTEIEPLLEVFNYGTTGKLWPGYYVLGSNIDAQGAENNLGGWVEGGITGLTGTFDGRGYTISNMKMTKQGGLFGRIGLAGTVKNVAFDNVEINGNNCFVLAFFPGAGTVIENVYINATTIWGGGGSAPRAAALFSLVNIWSGANLTLRNVVVKTPLDLENTKNVASLFGGANFNSLGAPSGGYRVTAENVFVISSLRMDSTAIPNLGGFTGYGIDLANMTRFDTLEAAQSAQYPDSLKTGVWKTITAGELPVFASAV